MVAVYRTVSRVAAFPKFAVCCEEESEDAVVLAAECNALHCFLFLPASYLEQRHRPEARNYFYWDTF
jgi:hypothetical protein